MRYKNMKYFVIDPEGDGFCGYATKEEAMLEAEKSLSQYRADATDEGWPDDLTISVCQVIATTVKTDIENKEDLEDPKEIPDWADYRCDYKFERVGDL